VIFDADMAHSECPTDNAHRTHRELKEILESHGSAFTSIRGLYLLCVNVADRAHFATVSYMFAKKGILRLKVKDNVTFEQVFERAIECGAEDIEEDADGDVEVTTSVTESMQDLETRMSEMGEILGSDIVQVGPKLSKVDEDEVNELVVRLEDNGFTVSI